MIKALLVEDEVLAANRLQKMLQEIDPGIEILEILDSVESTVNWIKNNPSPDLLFLDIQLADGRSFDIFEHVKVQSPVIFTTAYDEFAINAFKLNSIDYLLKPIKIEELEESINKYKSIKEYFSESDLQTKIFSVLSNIKDETKSFKNRFLVNKGDSLIPVSADEIAYFYAEDKENFLTTFAGQKYFVNYSLDTLEEMLDPTIFFRVNRQFILAAKSISKVHNYFNYKLKVEVKPLIDKEIVISRAKTGEFKNWLNN
ncbi:LytR/AlgR family response regulator transcription factor [Bacteroidota bacterium]